MSTNYYVKLPPKNHCTHCGRQDPSEVVHIGKYSGGWKFSFHTRFKTYKEWMTYLEEHKDFIYDEYGCKEDLSALKGYIESAQDGLWLYDPRYERTGRWENRPGLEYLDEDGYRFVTAEEFF